MKKTFLFLTILGCTLFSLCGCGDKNPADTPTTETTTETKTGGGGGTQEEVIVDSTIYKISENKYAKPLTNYLHSGRCNWIDANDIALGKNGVLLSKDEWNYLLHIRPNADNKWARVTRTISGLEKDKGIVFFPDGVNVPKDLTQVGPLSTFSTNKCDSTKISQWESVGAFYLITDGYCDSQNHPYNTTYGYYWTSTKDPDDTYSAYMIYFNNTIPPTLASFKKSNKMNICVFKYVDAQGK